MDDLLTVAPEWVQLLDDEDLERLTVLELDAAVADEAPWDGYPVQLAVSVDLVDPDPQGQPYDDEHAALALFRLALEQAIGRDGRLVATITMDGVREHLAYVRSAGTVERWREHAPEGFAGHDVEVQLLEDPGWLGLREVAGSLRQDEQPLRPPE